MNQATQEIPRIFGTQRFITAFTRAHNLSLSWAISIQSMSAHPTSRRSILILSSHLHGLPSGLFPQISPLKLCMHFSSPPYMLHALLRSREHKAPCYVVFSTPLLPLRYKYPSQHPILKNPQPTFLPQCEQPTSTTIQNNRQYYTSAWKTKDSAPNDSRHSLISVCS